MSARSQPQRPWRLTPPRLQLPHTIFPPHTLSGMSFQNVLWPILSLSLSHYPLSFLPPSSSLFISSLLLCVYLTILFLSFLLIILRLGLALNFSVFYYEILNSPDRACHLAKQVLTYLIILPDITYPAQHHTRLYHTILSQIAGDNQSDSGYLIIHLLHSFLWFLHSVFTFLLYFHSIISFPSLLSACHNSLHFSEPCRNPFFLWLYRQLQ